MSPCATNPCGAGTCAASGANYSCTCPATHEFKNGTCVALPVDACPGICNTEITCSLQPLNCPLNAWPADWVAKEDEFIVLINQKRAAGATCPADANGPTQTFPPGAQALQNNAEIRTALHAHTFDMANRNYFSHTTAAPQNWSPWQRMEFAGFGGAANPNEFAKGEVLAAGSSTAQGALDQWMNSAGHCRILMDPKANQIGVGYTTLSNVKSDRVHYWGGGTGCIGACY